jgi:OmpA-OmpF porin, OOP family
MRHYCLLGASVALAVAFGCAPAHAQILTMPSGGAWYIGGEGGWTDLNNQSDRGLPAGFPSAPPGGRASAHFDDGFNVGARVGYQWGSWRLEEEYSYRENTLSSFNGKTPPVWKGHREAHALMTNVLYDFTIGWPISPHVGFGIGAVDVRDQVDRNSAAAPNGDVLSGDSWEFGYQAIAGVEYNVNPRLAVDLDYRYLATTDMTLQDRAFGGTYKTGYDSHNFLVSLIYRFAPPPVMAPPAPVAAPPPPPHQVYLVFFDWDKYDITPEGLQIIQQAAAQWRAGHNVRLEVTGFTDRSGSAGYNQRLSERRAAAVAGALEKLGVPRSDMAVQGRGENDNRVPTANGVREPQNRRVEIVFPT